MGFLHVAWPVGSGVKYARDRHGEKYIAGSTPVQFHLPVVRLNEMSGQSLDRSIDQSLDRSMKGYEESAIGEDSVDGKVWGWRHGIVAMWVK